KQRLIAILESLEEKKPLPIVRFLSVFVIPPGYLLLEGTHVRRQQPLEPKISTLLNGESTALVQQRTVQEEATGERHLKHGLFRLVIPNYLAVNHGFARINRGK